MPVRQNARGRWIYRTMVKLRDGSKVRVFGTPEINTKEAAKEEERAHIERVKNPPPPAPPKKEVPKFGDFADEFMLLARVALNDVSSAPESLSSFAKKRLELPRYAVNTPPT